ncbi:MAG: hypothetical protein IIA59_04005 [Candidatus Marinimicrobia bacterium]|nr:hypothetical protein [Candidatus Neomarinimicrobiota bacterium]
MIQATVGERTIDLDLRADGKHPVVRLDGVDTKVDGVQLSPYSWSLIIDGQSHHLSIRPSRNGYQVLLREQTYQVELRSEVQQTVARLGIGIVATSDHGEIRAPIPGLVTSLAVASGESVSKGDTVIVLEAMKMENEMTAPFAGTIGQIFVKPGDTVEKETLLLVIERTP